LTYHQTIETYKWLDAQNSNAKLITCGLSDSGQPLHLFIISGNEDFDPVSIRKDKKCVILINNGIHPGEADGIDASVKFAIDLLSDKKRINNELKNIVICIIPVYNIGGALNRNNTSRMNQNGPEAYGFRGNAKNLDLNRDFIKTDAENTRSFIAIYQQWKPEVVVDTHTSNGADYQYVTTLIAATHNKTAAQEIFLNTTFVPALYNRMIATGYEMIPYIDNIQETPDFGIEAFAETARYTTGYTSMYNSLGFVTEMHMFKPFRDRVLGTYHFLNTILETTAKNSKQIVELKAQADDFIAKQDTFVLKWAIDTNRYDMLNYKGYEAKHVTSQLTGSQRLYYDRNAPITKQIRNYCHFKPELVIQKPYCYVIPQAWKKIIDLLKINGVAVQTLASDTVITVNSYYIKDYKSYARPYEGHYYHYDIKTETKVQAIQFYQNDAVVFLNQPANRYIVETLEPIAPDSFFAWNFFDAILQQKEWFSAYVFEETAIALLEKNPELKKKFDQKRESDSVFAKNHYAQLSFIYQNSDMYEVEHNRYPIYRINQPVKLNMD